MKIKRHRHHAISFFVCSTLDDTGKVIKSIRVGVCKCHARRVNGKWIEW